MGTEMEFYEVDKRELCEHECDPHSLTRTRTLKGGWFGLTWHFKEEVVVRVKCWKLKSHLFKALVLPTIMYGTEMWRCVLKISH